MIRQVSTGRNERLHERIKFSLMAVPFVVLLFAFSYIPLFGWVYSFYNYKPGIPLKSTPFVGLENFILIFSDASILNALINTLVMGSLILLTSVLPVAFAIMITEIKLPNFRRLFQTVSTLPYFVSWIITYSIAFSIFSNDGVVNVIFTNLNLIEKPFNILGSLKHVWLFQTAITVWKGLGWGSIIYMAAITGIDSELYDASSIDGAGRFKRIKYITIPGILPTFTVLLLLSASDILSAGGLDQYLIFYNSLVAERIETLDYYVYRMGIATQDYSYATAVGMLKSIVSVAILFGVNKLSSKLRDSSII